LRNKLYDLGIFKTYEILGKSILIGNLSLGGTGKSPMTAFIVEKFKERKRIEILSRGYGRKTKGFLRLDDKSSALQVGDEPLMYFKRFGHEVGVNVCEKRVVGIKEILKNSKYDVLLLDDAFQHRAVTAGFSIVLTDFNHLFTNDYIFPVGNLRESIKGLERADLLVVSKSPAYLEENKKNEIVNKINFQKENIFFSSIVYGKLKSFSNTITEDVESILLVTGIANPAPLLKHLKEKYQVELMQFSDHHNFSVEDFAKIHKKFDTFATDKKSIVTTEKDYSRLVTPEFSDFISEKPWYYQEISITLDREIEFLEKINTYVRKI
jgi:tetraacyldisaccharide 4'-kinase